MLSLANNSYKSNMNLFYKFIKRQGFSIRNVTHVGKNLKEDSKQLTSHFFNIIYEKRNLYNIGEKYCQIGNMDETAIYFEKIIKLHLKK